MLGIGLIIGGLLGYYAFGPIGALIGMVLGGLFEYGASKNLRTGSGSYAAQARETFFNTTFETMGYIAKIDGRVSENEIKVARTIMTKMGLDAAGIKRAIAAFSRGKQADFSLPRSLTELKERCRFHYLLKLFLDMQVQAAYADGNPVQAKRDILQKIAQQLGLPTVDFVAIEEMFNGAHATHGAYQATARPTDTLAESYRILEISSSATNQEIKRAYRKLMSENHPDKLLAKGLPEEMIKVATEKTQTIQKAYDRVKSARGF